MTEQRLVRRRAKRAAMQCNTCGTVPKDSLKRFRRRHPKYCKVFLAAKQQTPQPPA